MFHCAALFVKRDDQEVAYNADSKLEEEFKGALVRRLKVLQGEARHSLGTSPTSLFIRVASRILRRARPSPEQVDSVISFR